MFRIGFLDPVEPFSAAGVLGVEYHVETVGPVVAVEAPVVGFVVDLAKRACLPAIGLQGLHHRRQRRIQAVAVLQYAMPAARQTGGQCGAGGAADRVAGISVRKGDACPTQPVEVGRRAGQGGAALQPFGRELIHYEENDIQKAGIPSSIQCCMRQLRASLGVCVENLFQLLLGDLDPFLN